ncbi:MAG TPA: UxaA family hydrolase, partial [Chitinophagaceae bacterium]|nr:UxaA family hydrolase [Chitinophagaceae bacterium]
MNRILKIHPKDNVIVALRDLRQGDMINFENEVYVMQEDVPAKHKFYTEDLAKGSEVIMYGVLVGKVEHDVKKGGRMTTENLRHAADPYKYRGVQYAWQPPDVSKFRDRTFMGYHRNDGRVGTANYWLFIPTVFCENRNLDVIREAMHNELGYAVTDKYKQYTRALREAYEKGETLTGGIDLHASTTNKNRIFKNVDGIKFLNHQGGCGGTRQDSAILENLLAAYADHPNVGGVTVLSLGCQHLQLGSFLDTIRQRNPHFNKPIHVFEQQGSTSEEDLVKEAIATTFKGLAEINKQERKPATLDKLVVGVKCGGSDGFSGLSANPAVGYFSDLLVALNGK